jgi:hypothetical protein
MNLLIGERVAQRIVFCRSGLVDRRIRLRGSHAHPYPAADDLRLLARGGAVLISIGACPRPRWHQNFASRSVAC